MKRLVPVIAALLLGMASVQSVAQTKMPKLEQRLDGARDRVYQGIRNGSVNRGEAVRLYRELDRVERMMSQARKDAVATKSERRDIADELAKVERDIDRATASRK